MAAVTPTINPRTIKQDALASFLNILESVRGRKSLVLERSLSASLSYIARFSVLQEHGVDNIFWLDDGPQKDSSQSNIVYLIRSDITNAKLVAGQVRELLTTTEIDYEFNIVMTPRRTLSIEQIFEEEGVLGDVTLSEWPLGFIPLEDDLLSIELPDAGLKDMYLRGIPTTVHSAAQALGALQRQYGLFPRIVGKGTNARRLADQLLRMPSQAESSEGPDWTKGIHTAFDQLVLVERAADFVTPLMTQLTYEGLIDEVFTIRNSQAEIPSSVVTAANAQLPRSGGSVSSSVAPSLLDRKTRKIVLDSSDVLFANLRDLNFAVVGPTLNKVARRLNEDYEERHQAKTVTQIKEFVSKLGGLQAEHQSLRLHTNLAEEIVSRTQNDIFNKCLEIQQNLVASGLDTLTLHESLEDLVSKFVSIKTVLRLVCLECLVNGGMKEKDLAFFKKEILQSYGYEHILTFDNLAKMGLIYPRGKATNGLQFAPLRRLLRLVVDDVDEQNPNDIAFVYSGYAPMSVRLVQCVLQKRAFLGGRVSSLDTGWRGAEDVVKNIGGPSFEEVQEGDTKSAQAKKMFPAKDEKKTTVVFFLGGLTFTEIAALRFIAKQEQDRRRLVIATTGIIDGKTLIEVGMDGACTPVAAAGANGLATE
ncbi:Sec1-like protein [Dipodascopsis tothii]|uniref:Sec1-like protein n=1 Tax=Dipodascopsis tothii TaxID=44089 RepID=UPI0034CF57D1